MDLPIGLEVDHEAVTILDSLSELEAEETSALGEGRSYPVFTPSAFVCY